MKKILLLKMSSMGDLIHCLPALTDLQQAPEWASAQVTWVAEESFIDIPPMHPMVKHVLPVALRRWKKRLGEPQTWREYQALKQQLRSQRWDAIVDCQGLLKSAWVARMAKQPVSGYDRHSIKEPVASYFYQHQYAVAKTLPAVERNRQLLAQALGYAVHGKPDFGLPTLAQHELTPQRAFAALIHGTSAEAKEWPEAAWVALGQRLNQQGIACVLFWGNEREHLRAQRIAAALSDAVVMPKLSIAAAGQIIAAALAVVAVDTGLAHLANTQNRPLITLYLDSEPHLTGAIATAHTDKVANLGGKGQQPSVDEVWSILCQYDLF
ncbi:MAG: lipopolysaccharide heptosyltransferase I [Neisseriaceae bacterium]|nr:lipopolysaccharide heptosyltransferase I [Neisseriaceae bacterium]MBP6863132.1 lipopolysaccharide heptosyltransferase I [Neisseriaceae bacterium]